MKKWILVLLISVCSLSAFAAGDQYLPVNATFQLCPNKSGGGFYWVDTTSGDVWKVVGRKNTWTYCGNPVHKGAGETGTYVPYKNDNGNGMYLLDTLTGEGWFYDGKKWRSYGVPKKEKLPQRKF